MLRLLELLFIAGEEFVNKGLIYSTSRGAPSRKDLKCTLLLDHSDICNEEQKSKKQKDGVCTATEDRLHFLNHHYPHGSIDNRAKRTVQSSLSLVSYEGALHLEATCREGGLIHFCFDEEAQKWRRSAPYAISLGIICQVGSFTLPGTTEQTGASSQLHLLFLSQSGNLIHFRARGFQQQPSSMEDESGILHDNINDPNDYSCHLPGSDEGGSDSAAVSSEPIYPQFAIESLGIILTQVNSGNHIPFELKPEGNW